MDITPYTREPSATSWAPVRVAMSTMASADSSPARTIASAMTSRPSASVFMHLDRLAAAHRQHVGRPDRACRYGMFSAIATQPTTLIGSLSWAAARSVAMTAAAPPMSAFIHSIAVGGLSDRPPESNVMPLPTR